MKQCSLLVLLALAVGVAADPGPDTKGRLAVLDFSTGEGLKPDDGQTLAMFVRSAIVQTGKFDVMERQQIKQLLDEQKFQEVVCDDAKCMVKAGKILAVNRVLGGRVAKLGSVWTVVLNLADVESARLINSHALPFDGPVESLLNLSSTAALMLLGLKPADSIPATGTIQGRQLGETYVNSVGALMLRIPQGEFMMGSTADEKAWAKGPEGKAPETADFSDEGAVPRRTRIPSAFWMGRTEVTVGQWRQFVSETGYQTEAEKRGEAWAWDSDNKKWGVVKGASWRDPGYGFSVKDDHPVACISWNDATAFCEWLTKKEKQFGRLPAGFVYRLPTEAEWEYACRGGRQGTKFWWGDSLEDGKGRLNLSSKDDLGGRMEGSSWSLGVEWKDGFGWVSPVDYYGERGRNGFGLADMLGNVWEWCLDGYDPAGSHEEPYTADTSRRVARGGAFRSSPASCDAPPASGVIRPSPPPATGSVCVVG